MHHTHRHTHTHTVSGSSSGFYVRKESEAVTPWPCVRDTNQIFAGTKFFDLHLFSARSGHAASWEVRRLLSGCWVQMFRHGGKKGENGSWKCRAAGYCTTDMETCCEVLIHSQLTAHFFLVICFLKKQIEKKPILTWIKVNLPQENCLFEFIK